MTCSEIMKKVVVYLNPDDTAQVAARLMADANVGFLPVCDRNGKAIGTLTDRDLAVRLVAENKGLDSPVNEFMTEEVVACAPEDDVDKAAALMAEHQKSRILICEDDGRLAGVISLSDLPRANRERAFEAFESVSDRESAPLT